MRRISLLIFSLFIGASLLANEKTVIEDVSQASEKLWEASLMIEDFSQEFLISTVEGRAQVSNTDQRIQYNPSVTTVGGARIQYRGLGWTFKTKLREGDDEYIEERGQSEFYDFATDFSWGNHSVDIYYRSFEGFYADLNATSGFSVNTDGVSDAPSSNAQNELEADIIKRPDLKSMNTGFNYGYTASLLHPFKEDAAINTADSFPLYLDVHGAIQYDYFSFYGNEAFIPRDRQNEGFNSTLSRISSHSLGAKVGAGFGYYFSERSSFGTKLLFGQALSLQDLTSSTGTRSNWASSDLFEFDLHYHYRGSRFLFNLSMAAQVVGGETAEDVFFDSNAMRFNAGFGVLF